MPPGSPWPGRWSVRWRSGGRSGSSRVGSGTARSRPATPQRTSSRPTSGDGREIAFLPAPRGNHRVEQRNSLSGLSAALSGNRPVTGSGVGVRPGGGRGQAGACPSGEAVAVAVRPQKAVNSGGRWPLPVDSDDPIQQNTALARGTAPGDAGVGHVSVAATRRTPLSLRHVVHVDGGMRLRFSHVHMASDAS